MDKHFQSVNGFECGNKQDVTLLSAKADVGSPVLGNGEMGYLLPILVEYGHAVACQIDISRSSIVIPSDPILANTCRFESEPSGRMSCSLQ